MKNKLNYLVMIMTPKHIYHMIEPDNINKYVADQGWNPDLISRVIRGKCMPTNCKWRFEMIYY